MVNITQKQYVISAVKRDISNMKEVHLPNDIYLYIGKHLNVQYINNAKGELMILLGNAFITNTKNKDISEDIISYFDNDLNELVKSWTGRWLLITQNEIQIDACGLMGAFYTLGTEWCISSSLALMSQITGTKANETVSTNGLEWQLLPYTLLPNVFALFCTQKFLLKGKELSVSFNKWITDYSFLTTNEKVERINYILHNAIYNIGCKSNRNIWIALTGGKDSRLVLAAAIAANINFKSFTLEHDNISISDKKIPRKIAKDLGFEHIFIKTKKTSKSLKKDYQEFCNGNSLGVDIKFYAKQQFNKIPSNAIIIRSGIFEAGQRYGRRITSSNLNCFEKNIKNYYQNSLKNQRQMEAFDKWLEYTNNNKIEFIDIRDRMYIEQRVGGWAAAIEQALCINDWNSIQIANCRELVSILLSATEEERNNLSLSIEPIKKTHPLLHSYPYNKPTLIDKLNLIIKTLKSPIRLTNYIHRRINN